MTKKHAVPQKSAGKKRGLSIPDEQWKPFAAFVKSVRIRNGSRQVNVSYSEAAMVAFRLLQAFGVEKVRTLLFDERCQTEEFWSRLGRGLGRSSWPEPDDQP